MTTLEELIKQRDQLDEQIEALKNKQEAEELEEVKSKYLNKIVRQYRGNGYDDIIFLKIKEIPERYDEVYLLTGDGVYLEPSRGDLIKCSEEQIELDPEYDTKVVTKEEMIEELNKTMYEYFE